VKKAFASGMFIYADADVKFDQPQAEVVFDRDKLRSQGVDLSQAGRDLSTLVGANYVNRFSIDGRSYKVIPQVARAERLTPDQLEQIYVTGSHDRLVPLSTFASLKASTEPRDLKKFQQLTPSASRSDSAAGSTRSGAWILETEARRSCRRASRSTTRASRGSFERRREVPRHVPALGGADLPGSRGAVRKLPRSIHRARWIRTAGAVQERCCSRSRLHDAQHLTVRSG